MLASRGATALVIALLVQSPSSALPFRTIALSGEPAPGTPAGVVFAGFESGDINAAGAVVFQTQLAGPGVEVTHPSNSYGIWRDDHGVLNKVVRAGEQALGRPASVNYYLPQSASIDAAGNIAFIAETPGVSTRSIYSEGLGSLRLVASEGGPAPGLGVDGSFYIFENSSMNAAGGLAFSAHVRGAFPPTQGIWTDQSGELAPVILEDAPTPGTGTTLLQIALSDFNDQGVIALTGRHTGGTFPNDYAVWTEQGGTFSLLARSVDSAPGMPAGVIVGRIDSVQLNNSGQVLFQSALSGPGLSAANDAALWLHDNGTSTLVARQGDPAVSAGPGVNLGEFARVLLNDAGQSMFLSTLSGPSVTPASDTALWAQDGDELVLVAREGDLAPGAGGARFGSLADVGNGLGQQFNGRGQVAFEAPLTGLDVTAANDRGMWVTDLSGTLRMVTREGDPFDVSDGPLVEEFRTVRLTNLQWLGNSSFNDNGQLVIALNFTDDTAGAFVIDTAVPEPSTAVLAIAAVGAALGRQRRVRPR
jgi:hypothetical protein